MLDKKLSVIEIRMLECGDVRCIVMERVSSQKGSKSQLGCSKMRSSSPLTMRDAKHFGDARCFGKSETARQDSFAL